MKIVVFEFELFRRNEGGNKVGVGAPILTK